MSFQPLSSNGIATSLLGTGEPIKYVRLNDVPDRDSGDVREYRDLHGPRESKSTNYTKTIILIVISALIFISVVALYDILRNAINNYYAKKSLSNPNSNNSNEDIVRTEIANKNNLISSIVFALVSVLIAIVLIAILVWIMIRL